jgi:hypothetical protein
MPLITEEYLELNKQLHAKNPRYGTQGTSYLDNIIKIAGMFNTQDILDYGCGKSTLALNLPFVIKQYDPAIPKFAELPRDADIVICTDVLEHIEPWCLEDVLDHIQSLARQACFISGSVVPAHKTLPDGRNAHLIQKPARWWMDKLWDRFDVLNFTQYQTNFTTMLLNKTQGQIARQRQKDGL